MKQYMLARIANESKLQAGRRDTRCDAGITLQAVYIDCNV